MYNGLMWSRLAALADLSNHCILYILHSKNENPLLHRLDVLHPVAGAEKH